MWPRLQSFFNRINKDPKLEELLERNKKALDKKRQEAGLPSYRAHSARKNPTNQVVGDGLRGRFPLP